MAFLAFSVPRYLTGDPAQSRVPSTFGWHYPLLVAHVLFASAAMVAAALQVWPGLRKRRPVLHRRVGRGYVFGAVLPAGVCGLILGAATPFGPVLAASNMTLAVVWLWSSLAGWRAARRRDFRAHRRWMLTSVVLTFSIISTRIWIVVMFIALNPLRDSLFGGSDAVLQTTVASLSGWLGWTVPLIALTVWLRRQPAEVQSGRGSVPSRRMFS